MSALVIAANSLRRLARDRSNVFFVVVFPLLLIFVLGLSFGGGFVPTLAVVAAPGELADGVLERLRASDDLEVVEYPDEDAAVDAVARGVANGALVLPEDFERAADGASVEAAFASDPQSGGGLRAIVDAAVTSVAQEVLVAGVVADQTGRPVDEALSAARDALARTESGGVEIEEIGTDPVAAEFAGLGRYDLGASSQLLLFTFLTSLAGGAALIQSRQLGVTRRMLATPTTARTILFGETLGRFGVALAQSLIIVFGALLLFGVEWGDPFGATAVIVVFALVSAGAGMLVGSIFDNDAQAGGIGVFAGLALAALGGSMAPLEVFPETMQQVARLTPHAWGNLAFADLVRRDGGLVDILPELGVLAAFAVVLLVLGGWRLQRTLTR